MKTTNKETIENMNALGAAAKRLAQAYEDLMVTHMGKFTEALNKVTIELREREEREKSA